MTTTPIYALIPTVADANQIVIALRRQGFGANDISLLFQDPKASRYGGLFDGTSGTEGAAAGIAIGGVMGGALGWLAGIGSLVIPGLGPVIASGPLMAMLTGTALGAALGGLSGTLIGLGIPEPQAASFDGRLRMGRILISVTATSVKEVAVITGIYERLGATDVTPGASVPHGAQVAAEMTATAGATAAAAAGFTT